MNLAALNAEKARHEAAWKLVCPTLRGAHWKDAVAAYVTIEQAVEAGGIEMYEIAAAVAFFTATEATIAPVDGIGGTVGYLVTADGYRRGPAGDG
jgi:hypothetical protein